LPTKLGKLVVEALLSQQLHQLLVQQLLRRLFRARPGLGLVEKDTSEEGLALSIVAVDVGLWDFLWLGSFERP
jgi:hypothetical protein